MPGPSRSLPETSATRPKDEQLSVLHRAVRPLGRGGRRVSLDVGDPDRVVEDAGDIEDPAGLPHTRAHRDAVPAGRVELRDTLAARHIDAVLPVAPLDREPPDASVPELGGH